VRVAGVDATKGGWVAVVLDNGRVVADHLVPTVQSTFSELQDVAIIAIDVPVGFGPRRADAVARASLKGAASTVFTTPPRSILETPFRAGLGVSAQAHALGPRILHVTALAESDSRIREVHPEVSFRAMNHGRPLHYRKKSAGGALERIEILRRHGIYLTELEASAFVPLDDVLDAGAAAWTAHRIATGVAESLPDPPEHVAGIEIAIWF
jgi:predicted RNase H-like nuclease